MPGPPLKVPWPPNPCHPCGGGQAGAGPAPELEPWTCEWAQEGLRRASDAEMYLSGLYLRSFQMGTRNAAFAQLQIAQKAVADWTWRVWQLCGPGSLPAPPQELLGFDQVRTIVQMDW
jgi:hypothetical protein